ncbi:hypothetical protein FB472_1705 [Rhodoglobus vestalii]|uniref:Uncharacterized protein n=1 Tax=Rhodoglobus vestalii TaxID=193384 RepID=A0A8H2PY85_9MICO|nr:hypothetical protein FB472_1705 [Rhodoglobus vestalii]
MELAAGERGGVVVPFTATVFAYRGVLDRMLRNAFRWLLDRSLSCDRRVSLGLGVEDLAVVILHSPAEPHFKVEGDLGGVGAGYLQFAVGFF